MSVYVDMIRKVSTSRRWSHDEAAHLMADSLEELHAFAAKIGLAKCWFHRGSSPHYDVNRPMWEKAIRHGAIELDRKQTVALIHRLRGGKTVEQALADEKLPVHIAQKLAAKQALPKQRAAKPKAAPSIAETTSRPATVQVAPAVHRRSRHELAAAAFGSTET